MPSHISEQLVKKLPVPSSVNLSEHLLNNSKPHILQYEPWIGYNKLDKKVLTIQVA